MLSAALASGPAATRSSQVRSCRDSLCRPSRRHQASSFLSVYLSLFFLAPSSDGKNQSLGISRPDVNYHYLKQSVASILVSRLLLRRCLPSGIEVLGPLAAPCMVMQDPQPPLPPAGIASTVRAVIVSTCFSNDTNIHSCYNKPQTYPEQALKNLQHCIRPPVGTSPDCSASLPSSLALPHTRTRHVDVLDSRFRRPAAAATQANADRQGHSRDIMRPRT